MVPKTDELTLNLAVSSNNSRQLFALYQKLDHATLIRLHLVNDELRHSFIRLVFSSRGWT